jgi:acetyl-CoA C-acetyltransferase
MRVAVICEPVRTPVGRMGGAFRHLSSHQLATLAIRGLLDRSEIPPDAIDDVILGNCYPTMEAPALGRVAALNAGLPITVPGLQVDRRCGSGLQAVIDASMRIQTGAAELIIAGGAESMSNASFYTDKIRYGAGGSVTLHDALQRGRLTAGGDLYPVPGGMIETAENLRSEYGIAREDRMSSPCVLTRMRFGPKTTVHSMTRSSPFETTPKGAVRLWIATNNLAATPTWRN